MSSPIRRALYTCILSFPQPPVEQGGLCILALPSAQEFSDYPCDTGSSVSALSQEFQGKVDFSLLDDGWNSNTGKWSPHCDAIDARARETRRFLRQVGRDWVRENPDGGRDCHIVLSTHGGFLHYVTGEWNGTGGAAGTGWRNCEFRSFVFAEGNDGNGDEDPDARLVELPESRARRPEEKILSPEEHRALREFAESEWVKGGYQKLPLPDVSFGEEVSLAGTSEPSAGQVKVQA
jgi:broad specificity phosphatase PhoE